MSFHPRREPLLPLKCSLLNPGLSEQERRGVVGDLRLGDLSRLCLEEDGLSDEGNVRFDFL